MRIDGITEMSIDKSLILKELSFTQKCLKQNFDIADSNYLTYMFDEISRLKLKAYNNGLILSNDVWMEA